MPTAVSVVQVDQSGVVRDQAGHMLVDEKGQLVCPDKRCRAHIELDQLVAQMVSSGQLSLDRIARLAYATTLVQVPADALDPNFIHNQWIQWYKQQGFPKVMRIPKPTFTSNRVVEMARLPEPRVPIYAHPKIDLGMLNDLFPEMKGHWSLQPNSGVTANWELSGWLFVEVVLEAPNRKTNQEQLEEVFRTQGAKGLNLLAYFIFGRYCKTVHGRYPDLETSVRILGSSCSSRVVYTYFESDGSPFVNDDLLPENVYPSLGGRSAVV